MQQAGAVVRRAAYDIGSGALKLQVCDVDPAGGRVVATHFAEERPVKFAIDWKHSRDGRLSEAIQQKGIAQMRELAGHAARLGVQQTAAIATEVYRKAANGAAFLERLAAECGVRPRIVSQEEEARLGLLTAVAYTPKGDPEPVSWDSGGGSFQITAANPQGGLRTYVGALGSGVALAMLLQDIQGRTSVSGVTPNPCPPGDAAALLALLRAKLQPAPEWLRRNRGVIAIGGPNSLFADCVRTLRFGGGRRVVTAAAARDALGLLLERTDSDLEASYAPPPTGRDPVAMLVPKLCLLVAVMEHLQLDAVTFQPTIGSCAGMMLDGELFRPREQAGARL
eukprot:TRINITY_DN18391_c0_g4_i1.p1 TRINITY_DN18391_c0_g4~~TRINITY_DN18391_c0_g4_i1.p1  ORF type:complete len:338 (+),score=100.46 TRINITY_DN18391_c0_g4_i1:84-1097(+)